LYLIHDISSLLSVSCFPAPFNRQGAIVLASLVECCRLGLPSSDDPVVYQVPGCTPSAIRQPHRRKTMQRVELIKGLGADLHIPADVSDPCEDTWLFVSLISFHVKPPDRAHRYYLDYSSVNSYGLSVISY
jgi:hypothetical protein